MGLVVSVRSNYLESIIPTEGLGDGYFIQETHRGFEDYEFEATNLFFKTFEIVAPAIPDLNPEFQNPLFLLLFCEGLKNSGNSTIPDGLSGITNIFNFYINSINTRLSKPNYLDYNKNLNVVQKSIDAYIELLLKAEGYYVGYEEVLITLNKLANTYGLKKNFSLISEGIFQKIDLKAKMQINLLKVFILPMSGFQIICLLNICWLNIKIFLLSFKRVGYFTIFLKMSSSVIKIKACWMFYQYNYPS